MPKKKILNIHIDESGNFADSKYKDAPKQYLVTMIFHDQDDDISSDVQKLEESIAVSGFNIEYIHTAPLIRRQEIFENYSLDDRRKLIFKMFNFFNHVPITHKTVVVDRRQAKDRISLSGELGKQINRFLQDNLEFFSKYDAIEVFYDGGQEDLSAILNTVFSIAFPDVKFKKAQQQKYRLMQVADFVCTFELMRIKFQENRLSNSEKQFFYKPKELQKSFLKSIDKRKFEK